MHKSVSTSRMENFVFDKEKMADFKRLSKDEFLKSYSYLTEKEYDNTVKVYELLKTYTRYCYREFDDEPIHMVGENQLGIFGSDYELEDGNYQWIDVYLFYNDEGCEYVSITDHVAYRENVSYEEAIRDLNDCSFDDFYNYFTERSFK